MVSRSFIAPDEYADRIDRVRALLTERDLDGVLVWGRGGGAVDRFADVAYLTGFYPSFPTIRDVEGVWSDRGFCAVLVTADDVVLFADEDGVEELSHGVTRAVTRSGVTSRTLVGDVADTVRSSPSIRRILLAAGDAMTGPQALGLQQQMAVAGVGLVTEPAVLEDLRMHKSPAEIDLLRSAAEVAQEALEAGFRTVVPGAREADAVAAMAQVIAAREAVMANAFVLVTRGDGTMDDNRLPVHSGRTLEAGDVFTVDLSGVYRGYFFDLARSVVVGGRPTDAQHAAYDLARASVNAVVESLRPGVRLGDAAARGSAVLREAGLDPEEGVFPARGHGLGLGLERPWIRDESDSVVAEGMVLSVEQFCTLDGIGATFERNLVITQDGAEDLVAVRDFWLEMDQ